MPNIITQVQNNQILVEIAISKPGQVRAAAISKGGVELAKIFGLIDTGATSSCVSPLTVERLGLEAVGKVECQGVAGVHSALTYKIDLTLGTQPPHCFENLIVAELTVPEENHFQAIIGMDIIMRGVLTLSPDGHFVLST